MSGHSAASRRVVGQSSFAWLFEFDKPALVWLLAGYGFLASVLPGWMLLVPRGYLSTFMKLGVVFLLGLLVLPFAPETKGEALPEEERGFAH